MSAAGSEGFANVHHHRRRPSRTGARRPLYKPLFFQVLFALILGVALGMATPEFAQSLKILSDAFLKLISMIVGPIVFCVVVHGIVVDVTAG